MKTCSKCGDPKPLSEFYPHSGCRDGRHPACKRCHIKASVARQRADPEAARERSRRWRERHPEEANRRPREWAKNNPEKHRAQQAKWRKNNPESLFAKSLRKFGLTPDGYRAILKYQEGKCAICRMPEKFKSRLAVDHSHETGKIRGLLCRDCNTSLGKLHDSAELLRRAADYLETGPLSVR